MMISGLGYSNAEVTAAQVPGKAGISTEPDSTGTDSISLTTNTIDSVQEGTSNFTLSSNVNYLFSKLNAGILYAGDLSGVQSAVDTYTNSLSTSNVYMSSYTAPSAKFLNDLDALKSAANAGNLGDTESALAKAKLDAPQGVADGMASAVAKGDIAGETGLVMEGGANMAGYLATQGYTSLGAQSEANAIIINGVSLVGGAGGDPLTVQTRLNQISDIASSVAKNTAPNESRAVPTSSDPMFNIIESMLDAHSTAASNKALTALDLLYGTNGSGTASSVNSYA